MHWQMLEVRTLSSTIQLLRRKLSHQQTSSTSLAYTLLGGFVVIVGLFLCPSRIQREDHLIAVKYTLTSMVIKETVRYQQCP